MALESVAILEKDPNWKAPHPNETESAEDTFNRKIGQAEALSSILVAEDFATFNDVIQREVLWVLSDLITEARIAAEKMRRANP